MSEQENTARTGKKDQAHSSLPQVHQDQDQDALRDQEQREERILKEGLSSTTHGIPDAVAVKDGDIFLLTEPDGNIPMSHSHAYGLYHRDCRFLNSYELKIAGTRPNKSLTTASEGFMATFVLTNPEVNISRSKTLKQEQIGITWKRVLDGSRLMLLEQLTFENYELHPVEFPFSLAFRADFESEFAVRSLMQSTPGKRYPPDWKGGSLFFLYDGKDGLFRSLTVHFSPQPQEKDECAAHFLLKLGPREQRLITITLAVAQSARRSEVEPSVEHLPELKTVEDSRRQDFQQWLQTQTQVTSDSWHLNQLLKCSLRDLRVLLTYRRGRQFFAAGIPWYVALFGRDSLMSSMQVLPYEREVAASTLRLLASYQGTKVDDWQDEQPGKILHELRVGELAHLGVIPQTPYYGTVDATILFLILICRHAAWTGDLSIFNELRSNIERALHWMDTSTDLLGNGYIAYERRSKKGMRNHGWKDSGVAIMNTDGSLAEPPIALVEVQGYAYLAKTLLAGLYRRSGDSRGAEQLQQEAQELRIRFNRDFWMEDKGFYALAIQKGQKRAEVISSNPGQALWTGIVDADKASKTVERLMADDMFSGWGIRTLSNNEVRYNPLAYEIGSVWPHDNSLILAGFRRYGFDDEACQVFTAIYEAGIQFGNYRLPELFAGFSRKEYPQPARYPLADHPQAWASGSLPFMIETMLGLVPEAFDHRLRIVRPILPGFVDHLEVRRLHVGHASVDLVFERASNGQLAVGVLKVDGPLDVIVEPQGAYHW